MFAFVLAQKKFKAGKVFSLLTFFTMLFSGGLVPSYVINVRYLHLYDNFWILVLPGLVTAYNVIILRTFIKITIPDSMLEAAIMDGANDFRVYATIVMPLFKPALATIGLFSVVYRWNDWFTGMLYIENPKLVPLQTMLTRIQTSIDFIKKGAMEGTTGSSEMQDMLQDMPTESARMAITLIATLPILFIYPFFQKYFIKGLTVGSVKG
jgi:ABC-type sugar transport system, permease component